jgi:hypothetical protein
VPARSIAFVLLAALASMILILIHHIHLLMYVPTIAVIVVLRHYLVQGFIAKCPRRNRRDRVHRPAVLRSAIPGIAGGARAQFVQYLQGRMADPTRTNLLSFAYIWYQPLSQEIHDTWNRMPSNLLGIPVFALLIWLHAPLWKYFVSLIERCRASASPIVIAALGDRQRRLSRDVRDRVRLFALGCRTGRCACS